MSDLCYSPAHELRSKILACEISASELLECFIEQTLRYNPSLNALVTLDLEGGRKRAAELDETYRRTGKPEGVLHGLPIAVKDVFAVQGLRTTYGNPYFAKNVPYQDDILVERERAAGAVILGKSNTPDCASGGRTTNEIFGLSLNPWNPKKTSSGSGGGGVGALMGGMVSIADGSDIGGSVRSPGAWTNCVGFRPTSGRLPGLSGSLADGDTSTAGVFTRCVKDAALFMEACDGPDPRSPTPYSSCGKISAKATDVLPEGLRACWSPDFASRDMDTNLLSLFKEHRSVFEDCGLKLSSAELDLGENYKKLYKDFNAYSFVKGLPPRILKAGLEERGIKPSIQACIDRYRSLSAEEILKMFRTREELRVRAQLFMKDHDIVITPPHNCLAYGAWDLDGEKNCDWAALYFAPLLGLPSVVVPCGFTDDGMPNGVLITGRAGEDMLVLQVAAAFERRTEYRKNRPDLNWAN